jgi:hypothetical protein
MKTDNDMIKVWYQTDGGIKLYEVDIESVACDLQVSREELEEEMTIKIPEDESKQKYDDYLNQIKNLELDKEIEAYGFNWGCTMISQKELDSLPEFNGW